MRTRDNNRSGTIALSDTSSERLNTRLYFLPGFLNFSPHPQFMDRLATSATHGAAFVSVSSRENTRRIQGHHERLGDDSAVYHERWPAEVSSVILRIGHDLLMQSNRPERISLIGHSKGGLLAYSLKALSMMWFANDKSFTPQVLRAFPNLHRIVMDHREECEAVMNMLHGAKVITIGTPFEGLDDRLRFFAKTSGFDAIFRGTSNSFSKKYLEEIYAALHSHAPEQLLRPEHIVDGFVMARRKPLTAAQLLALSASPSSLKRFLKAPLENAGSFLFEMSGALLMPHRESDAVVSCDDISHYPEDRVLYVDANHIRVVEQTEIADRIVKYLAKTS